MEFTETPIPDGIVIALRGAFTFKDHHGFRAVLDALTAARGNRKVIDLRDVDFLDSAALGMLLIAEDEISHGTQKLTLRNPSEQVDQLFKLAAMDTMFHIERAGTATP